MSSLWAGRLRPKGRPPPAALDAPFKAPECSGAFLIGKFPNVIHPCDTAYWRS